MRILAIDPSLRSSGYAVLDEGKPLRAVTYGAIRNPACLRPSECLVRIHREIGDLVARHRPDCCAMEGVIYVQSHRTAITLGAARGAAILAVAGADLPIYEYAPRRVKQAVVGRGGAQKSQVGFMVRALLELTETPDADAADALAIGIAHFQAAHGPLSRDQQVRL